MASTISEVANKLSNVLTRWSDLLDGIGEWSNSTEDKVTFTKPNGETFTVSSLTHILDEVEGPAGTAQNAADEASAERQIAESAASDSESARDASQTARDSAQAAESNALQHRDDAQNAANNVAGMIDTRYPDDKSIRIPVGSTVTADTAGADGTFRWDDNYIYVMTSLGWRKAPLQDL